MRERVKGITRGVLREREPEGEQVTERMNERDN